MDLDARPLRSFIAVAEQNSFSRAAHRMNVSQPALSATISALEHRLGFALFDRSRRRIVLTAEGKLFLDNARRYVRENDILRRSWQEIRANELRISAAFHTALIPERNALIEGFLATHGHVGVQVHNDPQERGLARLARGEVDILIAIEPDRPPPERVTMSERGEHRTSIQRKILSTRPIGLLLPDEHPCASTRPLPVDRLAGMQIVVPGRFDGVAVAEQIRFALTAAGAEILRPPEGNAIGVERYGALRRLPAVTLNWLGDQSRATGMSPCLVPGLGSTHLSLVRAAGEPRPAAALFWGHAENRQANCGAAPPRPAGPVR